MATQTTYYEFNKPSGTDLVNPLTDTNPNWDIADNALHEINTRSFANATETVVIGVHAISRLNTYTKFIKWVATANFTAGDTFTVDGNVVAASTPAGSTLETNAYVTGSVVIACLNADDSAMTVYVGGSTTADNALRLGGELPSYYAKQSDMTSAQTDIGNIKALNGTTSIASIGDGTTTGAISAINAELIDIKGDLSDVTTSNRELIDTITTFNNTTDVVLDLSGYNVIEFDYIGHLSSASDKFHAILKFTPSELELIRADTSNKMGGVAPAILRSLVSYGSNSAANVYIYLMPAANTYRFNKQVVTYGVDELRIYGLK